jgi:hypothetical protein
VTVTDTTGPVISVSGSTTVTHEAAATYSDAGATALDAVGGTLSVTTSGTVTVGTPGAYTLTYSVTDASGNTTTATRTVTVQDTVGPVITLSGSGTVDHLDAVKPVITLTGDSSVLHAAGSAYSDLGAVATDAISAYTDAGASAVDALDGDVAVVVTGSVSVETAGDYILTFTATDAAGNATTATRVVTVPTLVKNLTSSIVTTSSVNENSAGSYQVEYNVSDSAGNAATTVSRTVEVRDPVKIVVQPFGGTLELGDSVGLWVLASGHGTLSYQWKKDGVAIAGETSNILNLADVTAVDSGVYSVTIQNSVSTVDSADAIVSAGDQMVLGSIASQFVKTGDSLSVAVQLAGKPTNLKYVLSGAPDGMSISSEGLISWVVGSEHDGNSYNVSAIAIDQDALAAVGRGFTVTVNHNPKWEAIGAQSVKEQNPLTFAPVAIDLDDTDLTLVASGLPAGASYDSSSGFTWTPGNGQIGVHDVGFTVTDPHGSKSDLTVQITVNANVAPTLAAISSVSILAGESAGAQADASDTDDDNSTLAYSLDNAPEGMQVSESGSITWATQSGIHSGEYTTDVVVTDSLGASASQQFKVVVDGAPVVESIDAIILKIGGKVKFTVAASDPEDGKLTYKALNNPDGFKGSARNGFKGKFNWTTVNAPAGDYKIDIEVADVAGLKSVVSVQVTLKTNLAPTIESLDPVVVDAGGSVEIQVVADDVDDDNSTLRYVLENAPEGMQVSGDGLIQWLVDNLAETAVYSVTVIALDGDNAMGKQVLEASVKANVPPTIEDLDSVTVKSGGSLELQVIADDPDGDNANLSYLLEDAPAGMQISGSGLIQWAVPGDAEDATYSVSVSAVDDRGSLAMRVLEVTVDANRAPTVEAIAPIVANVGDKVRVSVIATDPDGDALTYKEVALPAGIKGSLRNGLKGKFIWTTKDAKDGNYTIDIEVSDTSGNKAVVTVQISLIPENKVPTVEAIAPIVAKVGDRVRVNVIATDPDGDALTYKEVALPTGIKGSVRNGHKGRFNWRTNDAKEGSYTIDIEVSDTSGNKAVVTVQITLKPVTTLALLSAPAVVGPFAPEAEAVIDENGQSITVAKAGGMRFYKLQSGDDTKLKITSIAIEDDNVVMSYKPAGE